MESKNKYNWDTCLNTTPYNKVLEGMRAFHYLIPTMFSEDKQFVFFASCDIDISVNDVEELKYLLHSFLESIKSKVREIRCSVHRLYRLEIDYRTAYALLSELNALPEGYLHPEYYLEDAYKQIGRQDE